MDEHFQRVIDRLNEQHRREEQEMAGLDIYQVDARLDEWMLPIGEEAGRFVNLLIKTGRFINLVELGTSVGYSTLWLAEAARVNGGRVDSVDISAEKQALARENLKEARLEASVNLVHSDALDFLKNLPEAPDFSLLDVWKMDYLPCFEVLAERIKPGAVIVADNMVEPPSKNTVAYRKKVAADHRFETVMVPIGNGLEVSRKIR